MAVGLAPATFITFSANLIQILRCISIVIFIRVLLYVISCIGTYPSRILLEDSLDNFHNVRDFFLGGVSRCTSVADFYVVGTHSMIPEVEGTPPGWVGILLFLIGGISGPLYVHSIIGDPCLQVFD